MDGILPYPFAEQPNMGLWFHRNYVSITYNIGCDLSYPYTILQDVITVHALAEAR